MHVGPRTRGSSPSRRFRHGVSVDPERIAVPAHANSVRMAALSISVRRVLVSIATMHVGFTDFRRGARSCETRVETIGRRQMERDLFVRGHHGHVLTSGGKGRFCTVATCEQSQNDCTLAEHLRLLSEKTSGPARGDRASHTRPGRRRRSGITDWQILSAVLLRDS